MHIAHHPIFIALSSLTAWLGAWTALDVFRRVRAHAGTSRLAWLAATAVAMGLSIWSMHFIAMLGFNPGAEVRYDVGLTVLSLLLAIATTAFAFFFARGGGPRREIMGGVVMGAGICTMHYVGMSAVITSVTLTYAPVYVVLAFLVAVTASTSALFVARSETTALQRVLAAGVLAFAIVGMHYTAMYGVHVLPGSVSKIGSGGVDSLVLAVAVAAGTLFILLLALIAAVSEQARESVAVAVAEKTEAEAALMRAQRLDALGRLTGGVAHDFNNLLTVVIGALDVILRHPENAPRRQRLGEAALIAARRGQRLTAQLLAFARQQPLQPEIRELNERRADRSCAVRGQPAQPHRERSGCKRGGRRDRRRDASRDARRRRSRGPRVWSLFPPERCGSRAGHEPGCHEAHLRALLHDQAAG